MNLAHFGILLEMNIVMTKQTLLNVDTTLRIVVTWKMTEVSVQIVFVTSQRRKKSCLMKSLTKIAHMN